MTNGSNRLLDDLAKLMTDAAGAAQGVRREVETAFKAQAERLLNSMEVVQREEFDAVRDMAVKARAENKALATRIDALEARIAQLAGAAASAEGTDAAPRAVQKNNYSFLFHKAWKGKSLFGESLTRLP
jgi:BMFP domain-containing protein YqiC